MGVGSPNPPKLRCSHMGFKEIQNNSKSKIGPKTAELQTIGLKIECMNKMDPSYMQFVPLFPPHHNHKDRLLSHGNQNFSIP